MNLVEVLKKEVESKCKSPDNKFGYGCWSYHMVSVIDYAVELADILRADKEIVEIAAVLHDYASVYDYELYEEHHIHGARLAEELLRIHDVEQRKIDHIKACIYEHRGSKSNKPSTKESVCVASADAIAHIVNVPSLLHLAYATRGLDIEEGKVWVKAKLNRSWKKLCPEAKELVSKEYEYALGVLD